MNKTGNREFIIPIKGIPSGKHNYSFTVEKSFFEEFGNLQILGSELVVLITLQKTSSMMDVEADITGRVIIECDRCLEEMEHKINSKAVLLVKFKKVTEEEDNDEIITLEPSESELDLRQFIYDYICLALPIQRIHPDGACNPDMIKKLESLNRISKDESKGSSPFEKLKDLMN